MANEASTAIITWIDIFDIECDASLPKINEWRVKKLPTGVT